ncbi:MAG: FkbM family methyltransferase [Chloroflexota bacterium]
MFGLWQRIQGRRPFYPISQEHVVWAYRLFLDREPESEAVIEEKLRAWRTTRDLRADFMTSAEFQQKNPDLAYVNERNVVIKEIGDQLRLFVDLSDYVIGLGIIRGRYETGELAFVRETVKPGQTVLDVGANIGLFTITMAALVGSTGKVFAFESLERNAELLERSVVENGFQDQVVVERAAVSEQPGQGSLVSPQTSLNWGGAFLHEGESEIPAAHNVDTVQLVSLDTYPLPRPISFIKIDIEGAEPLALHGAREMLRVDRPVILSELNPVSLLKVAGYTSRQFVAEMNDLGYKCCLLEKGRLHRTATLDTSAIQTVAFLP